MSYWRCSGCGLYIMNLLMHLKIIFIIIKLGILLWRSNYCTDGWSQQIIFSITHGQSLSSKHEVRAWFNEHPFMCACLRLSCFETLLLCIAFCGRVLLCIPFCRYIWLCIAFFVSVLLCMWVIQCFTWIRMWIRIVWNDLLQWYFT